MEKKEKKNPLDNLKPFNSETARAGQKKGTETKRRKKAERKKLKEALEVFLSLPLKDKKAITKLKSLGIEENDLNNQAPLIIALWQKALKGDVNAFNTIRDTLGEKAVEKVEVTKSVDETVSELEAYLCKKKKQN